MTGGTAAVVDFIAFLLLLNLSLPVVVCAIASWIVAAVVNYLLTSRFVFAQRPSPAHGLKFIAIAAIGLIINVAVTTAGADYLSIAPAIAKALGTGTAFIFNFLANVRIVFR
jgi:putative flippase GtrA